MNRVLVAGATGYLGKYIVAESQNRDLNTTVLVRNKKKAEKMNLSPENIFVAEVTEKDTLADSCNNIDVVISSLGITRQRDGKTYMDVDYQGNMNLLEEAKKANVKKFIYVSALKADQLREVQICDAKEKFVDELKKSGLDYSIIRPNGFFSDITEFYNMAKKGKVFLFGDGELKSNPIHGADLAEVCVDAVFSSEKEINVGGPEVLTHNQIAETAFAAVGKSPKISYIPDWIRKSILRFGKVFLPAKMFGPIQFFMTVMAKEMVAPIHGKITLKEYFYQLHLKENKER